MDISERRILLTTKPPYRLPRSVRGFTFMELLIALTIFAIIASSIYYTLGAGIRVYRRGNTVIRDNQKLRIFFDTISQDLRNAVIYSDEKNNFYIEPEWLGDRISFPAIVNLFDESGMRGELVRVSYYLEKDRRKKKKFVMKRAGVHAGFDEEEAQEEILLGDLEDFTLDDVTFEYCYKVPGFDDEYDWREDEEYEDPLPRGIRINLTLKNTARRTKEVFRETVFVAMGELGDDTK